MSSDESVSTNISKLSNRESETQEKKKFHLPEEWEIKLIGNFLLDLYHRLIISHKNDWCLSKSEMRELFSKFATEEEKQKLKKLNGTQNIGNFLDACGFLINTARDSSVYRIKYKSLFEFRNDILNELDNSKVNNDGDQKKTTINSNDIEDYLEIDENEPKIPLDYQGSTMQQRIEDFIPSNMSCYICQEDFTSMDSFEDHVQIHGEDTDFEFLTKLDKFNSPIFVMSYKLCKNSHNFCFEFETGLENIIIEKIIIVQSRSFFYVHNMRVPYNCSENGVNRFFVDSHLFTIHVEQPIVIICHLEDSEDTLMIEQHHFMRSEQFPKVNFSINPNRLPDKKFEPKFKLPDYLPPKEIQDALKNDFYHESLMKTSNEFRDYIRNEKKLQPQTLGASLRILLQIEDMDTILQYLSLAQKSIRKLRSYGDDYSFQLKPKQRVFLENILSPFDEVILTTRSDIFTNPEQIKQLMLQNSNDLFSKNTFVGLIQSINTGRISFKCDRKINLQGSYAVIFRPSRLNFRYQYRALELLPINMDFLKKYLFPTKIISGSLNTMSLNLYNNNINGEQLQAVRNLAAGPRNDATYVIFGPPGTGKTTTLVEGILQILRRPKTKILVTASSNSACDEIALRLLNYLPQLDISRALVRIYSRSSEIRIESIDDKLLENSNMYNGQFYPDIQMLHQYRIVICTLSVVAKLATGKFGREDNSSPIYTHLIIDEVAASMETEALMAITTIVTAQSCLIIAGDNKQLGPILQSKRAKELGLDASLMDRLLTRDCYRVDDDTGNYDRTIQTRLVRNYRSHPAIVNLYSNLYYNHSLESHAKYDEVSIGEVWHKSRNKQYPISFHAIHEPSQSDRQSHSLYNPKELEVVMDYVKDFMYFGINGKPLKEDDIGIISPYKKQYKRIQEELNLRKWFNIATGSVEVFQGKEKNVIIVSFVRSGTDNLGFLDNPRRLNVTLSRAKCLLILIGNPKTLSLNKDFEYVIKECQRNNTFIGSMKPPRSVIKMPDNVKGDNIDKKNVIKKSQKNDRRYRKDSNASNNKNAEKFCNRNEKTAKNEENKSEEWKIIDELGGLLISGITDQDKTNQISQKRRRNHGGKRNNRARNRINSDQRSKNSEQCKDDNGNKDGNANQGSVNSINTNFKTNSRKGYDMRQMKKSGATSIGKISKQQIGNAGQRNSLDRNTNMNKNKLESIFNQLPQVPMSTKPETLLTNNQLLQFKQQQQQYMNNMREPQYFYNRNNGNNSFNHSPTTIAGCTLLPPYNPNPLFNQQHSQILNNFPAPYFHTPLNSNAHFSGNENYHHPTNIRQQQGSVKTSAASQRANEVKTLSSTKKDNSNENKTNKINVSNLKVENINTPKIQAKLQTVTSNRNNANDKNTSLKPISTAVNISNVNKILPKSTISSCNTANPKDDNVFASANVETTLRNPLNTLHTTIGLNNFAAKEKPSVTAADKNNDTVKYSAVRTSSDTFATANRATTISSNSSGIRSNSTLLNQEDKISATKNIYPVLEKRNVSSNILSSSVLSDVRPNNSTNINNSSGLTNSISTNSPSRSSTGNYTTYSSPLNTRYPANNSYNFSTQRNKYNASSNEQTKKKKQESSCAIS